MLRKDLEDRRSLLPRPSLPVEWREKSMKEFIDEPMVHEIRAGNYSQMKLGNKGQYSIQSSKIYIGFRQDHRTEDIIIENGLLKFNRKTRAIPRTKSAITDAIRAGAAENDAIEIIFNLCGRRKNSIPVDLAELMTFMTDANLWASRMFQDGSGNQPVITNGSRVVSDELPAQMPSDDSSAQAFSNKRVSVRLDNTNFPQASVPIPKIQYRYPRYRYPLHFPQA
ncbi:hypothetical protein V6N12_004112 [Hibiscus sabdariffa]|uniref:Uncharacterized protein n=1 Tax=Hibiscus sabdariffa TaxID=183260 RepID=A0ABR2CKH5_9ROSI